MIGGTTIALLGLLAAEFPNGSYDESQLFQPLVILDDTVMIADVPDVGQRRGSNAVMVLDGYFIIMGSADSGNAGGVIHVMDMSEPTTPVLVSHAIDPELRELHSMPATKVNGQYLTVLPSTSGIQVWDLAAFESGPVKVGETALEGVDGGDYDNTAWQITMAWPYAYVGSTAAGVHIVDISDPSTPELANRITTGEIGIGKAGPVYIAGNDLVVATMDTLPIGIGIIDVLDPMIPIPLGTGQGPDGFRTYSSLVIGSRIYGPGDFGWFHVATWEATDVSADVEFIAVRNFGDDKGGYCSYQDGFLFCGQSSDGFFKIDVSDESDLQDAGNGAFDVGDPDMDFATVLGNLVFVSNDHTGGPQGAFVPHQAEPDTTPPSVFDAYPAPGSTNIPVESRFTVYFTDDIDLATVEPDTFLVRRVSDGAVVDGVFTRSSLNAITFSPNEPLDDDETFVITLRPDGMTDVAGNGLAEDLEVGRWSTGDSIDESDLDPDPDPGGTGTDTGADDGSTEGGDEGGTDTGGQTTGGPEIPDAPMGGDTDTGDGGATETESSCACGTGGSAPAAWLGLALLLPALRRRRG